MTRAATATDDRAVLTKRRMESLNVVFRYHESVLMPILQRNLTEYGYKDIVLGKDYVETMAGKKINCPSFIYGPGTIPILLVSHCDTVWKLGSNGQLANGLSYALDQGHIKILAHREGRRIGLGADDRAGIWGISEILHRGFRPHILFTDGEETGAHGAREAAVALKEQIKASNIRMMIELDRANANDCVFYSCDNEDAVKWTESFGFKKTIGSFTDISVLMPDWGIAGVNVSVGYYRQHQDFETLHLDELMRTIGRISRMLKDPPKERIPFVEKVSSYSSGGSGYAGEGGYCGAGFRSRSRGGDYSSNRTGDTGTARGADDSLYNDAFCKTCGKLWPKTEMTMVVGEDQKYISSWICKEDCTKETEECWYCGKIISRKESLRRQNGKGYKFECKGQCVMPPLGKPILRKDGFYHLRTGRQSQCALALAFQMLYGATEDIEDEVKAMTADDIVMLESDLFTTENASLDDYCPHCRKFRIIINNLCTECEGHVWVKDSRP